jgi:hypothetical protein
VLDRGEQGLAFGHQQTQILGPFSGFLERRDLLSGAAGTRIVGVWSRIRTRMTYLG